MTTITPKKRIWGWMAFDFATQPFYTLGLTFIFGPYFAAVATEYYLSGGADVDTAKAQSQGIWSLGQTFAGLFIAFSAPFLGAFADSSGRKLPWIWAFSIIYVIASWALWYLLPDGQNLILILMIFYVGFIASESALNFTNAILPSLGNDEEIGRISGSSAAFGYWGGLVAILIMFLLLAEGDNGKTLIGADPLFGLDASQLEGTRSVGPFIAIWFMIAMIPFFLWVRDDKKNIKPMEPISKIASDLFDTILSIVERKSMGAFLLGSMFYRDALNALYAFGGVYAILVLDWSTTKIGVFGIVSIIAAAVFTYLGGRCDNRFGPKPVIITCVWLLIIVCITIVGMDKASIFGASLPTDPIFTIPTVGQYNTADMIFSICGIVIGGAGGALYAASRSMMVRHTHPDRPTEAFGLFALSGKATAFLAPAMIAAATAITKSNQLGFVPVIFLFVFGLILLRWVNKDGDRAEWSAS